MTDKLKLLPREATPEMLKAMDECSTEGYDERLYEGHAGSVYMAAWDAFHGQHCYCGDITNLGVIHRDDGPCHYPEHTSEYKRGYADAMNWKVQNHLEHLPAAQPKQEPVAWITQSGKGWLRWHKSYDDNKDSVPLYTTQPQRKLWVSLNDEQIDDCRYFCPTPLPQSTASDYVEWHKKTHVRAFARNVESKLRELNEAPAQRKPLTDEMIVAGGKALAKLHAESCGLDFDDVWKYYAEDHKADAKAAIEAAHGIKE